MTNQHPITPPPELVREWNQEATGTHFEPYGYSEFIAARAAQWGADQELEACCEWIPEYFQWNRSIQDADRLRAARRPNRPSLKEQAMMGLSRIESTGEFFSDGMKDLATIRRALEALPND